MEKFVLATNNEHKLREVRQILKDIEILSLNDLGIIHEVVEDADTFTGNALKKAREISQIANLPTLADDSGLAVDALDGAPGVYSARYSNDEYTGDDIDEANNTKLLRNMEGESDRHAKYVCVIAAVYPDGREEIAVGECSGEIAHERSGNGGFGYDSIFYLPQYGKTMAAISHEEKNKISHRAVALRKMVETINK